MDNFYDAIVIGAGPAGLTSAIYLARAKYRVLVLEKERIGGQIAITSEVVNYPGILRTDGKKLTATMQQQAENFGAEFSLDEVSAITQSEHLFNLETRSGKQYSCVSLLLALGASPRQVGFKGEAEFRGRGVAYCATCDGEFFTGREVFVVGGGFAALEEAMFLTRYAKNVTILVRKGEFSCAKSVVDKLQAFPTIKVEYYTEIEQVSGENFVTSLTLKNNQSGNLQTINSADGGAIGVFVFAGYAPATKLVKDLVVLNEQGYIVTDQNQLTSKNGIFAAGDVCIKNLRQVATAVGDGAIAATAMEKYIASTRETFNLPETQKVVQAKKPSQNLETEQHLASSEEADSDAFISEDMKEQMRSVFDKLSGIALIEAYLAEDTASAELAGFIKEFEGLHQNLETKITQTTSDKSYLAISKKGETARIRYYSIPGGHEFTSFVLAIYNVVGPGQALDATLQEQMLALPAKKIQVMATLACTNCPEVVMASQRIAAVNPKVEAEMYDLSKFPEIKDKYNILAVPCMIVDSDKVYFGKKSLPEMLEILQQ